MSHPATSASPSASENSNSGRSLATPRTQAGALRPDFIAALGGLLAGVLSHSVGPSVAFVICMDWWQQSSNLLNHRSAHDQASNDYRLAAISICAQGTGCVRAKGTEIRD